VDLDSVGSGSFCTPAIRNLKKKAVDPSVEQQEEYQKKERKDGRKE
jgi:hypothetical protein